MPKLSIITINLNNKEGLQKTMASVLSQTFSDYEYIIVDGGSSDGSIPFIEKDADKLAFWISEPDTGIYNAMNKGIIQAKGEYVLFLNSGDYLINKDVLSNIFVGLSESYDFISGDLNQIFPDGRIIKVEMPDKVTASYLFLSYISHPSTFIAKDILIRNGMYNETYRIAGDHAFFVKAFLTDTPKYLHIKQVISNYTMDGISSISKSVSILKEEREKAFREQLHPQFFKLLRDFHQPNRLNNFIRGLAKYLGIQIVYSLLRKPRRD